MITAEAYGKDASGAGRFAVDLIKRYRKYVAKGRGTHEEWEAAIAACARWAAHWASRSLDAGPAG